MKELKIDNFKKKLILNKLKDKEVVNIIFEGDDNFDSYSLLASVFFKAGDLTCCRALYLDGDGPFQDFFDIDQFVYLISELIDNAKSKELFYAVDNNYVFDVFGFIRNIYLHDFSKSLFEELQALATCEVIGTDVYYLSSKSIFNDFKTRISSLVNDGLTLKEIHIKILKEKGFDCLNTNKLSNCL